MVDDIKPLPRYLRILRITWTAGCVVVAVALVALWVRSYSHYQAITLPGYIELASDDGNFAIYVYFPAVREAEEESRWKFVGELEPSTFNSIVPEDATPGLHRDDHGSYWLVVPHGFPVLILLILAAVPWLPWNRWSNRFSLRTLLIATTLLSILLGTVVWLTH